MGEGSFSSFAGERKLMKHSFENWGWVGSEGVAVPKPSPPNVFIGGPVPVSLDSRFSLRLIRPNAPEDASVRSLVAEPCGGKNMRE